MRRALALLPVLIAFQAGAPPALAWTWPADGPVLRPFVLGGDPYAGGQHRGIDVGAATGEPVRAPAAGLVSFAGIVPAGGRCVTVETAAGQSVTLVHLGSIEVERGARVAEGAPVGTVGPSGDPEHAEPYVHLGIRVTAEPNGYLDPLTFLPARVPVPPPVPPADPPETAPATSAPSDAASPPPPAHALAAPVEAAPAAPTPPDAASPPPPAHALAAPVEAAPATPAPPDAASARHPARDPAAPVESAPTAPAKTPVEMTATAHPAARGPGRIRVTSAERPDSVPGPAVLGAGEPTASRMRRPAALPRTFIRSFEIASPAPSAAPRRRDPADPLAASGRGGRSGYGEAVAGAVALVALAAAALGLRRRHELVHAARAEALPPVLEDVAGRSAEDAAAPGAVQENRLVLHRDLERIPLGEPEPLPDLDRDDDPAELVQVPNDPCRRAPASVPLRRFHRIGTRAPLCCGRTEPIPAR